MVCCSFNADLKTLAKIPVLPALLELTNHEANEEVASPSGEEENRTTTDAEEVKSTTLLEWISASDNQSSMDHVFEHCSRGLEQVCFYFSENLEGGLVMLGVLVRREDF